MQEGAAGSYWQWPLDDFKWVGRFARVFLCSGSTGLRFSRHLTLAVSLTLLRWEQAEGACNGLEQGQSSRFEFKLW